MKVLPPPPLRTPSVNNPPPCFMRKWWMTKPILSFSRRLLCWRRGPQSVLSLVSGAYEVATEELTSIWGEEPQMGSGLWGLKAFGSGAQLIWGWWGLELDPRCTAQMMWLCWRVWACTSEHSSTRGWSTCNVLVASQTAPRSAMKTDGPWQQNWRWKCDKEGTVLITVDSGKKS